MIALWLQDDDESQLSFSEFKEMTVRIFHGREWASLPKEQRINGDFELAFDAWLKAFFIPTCLEAIHRKKRGKK